MGKTASNEAITKLKENRELETWIRTGLAHHKDSARCEFCGSTIPVDRLAALQKHFSKAYEDLTSEVAAQVVTLEKAKITITLPDERDFMPDLKDQFITLKENIGTRINWANEVIDALTALAQKKQLSLEANLNCDVDTNRAAEVTQIVEEINKLIATHNQKRTQIDREKRAAKEAVEKHHAATFYQTNNISDKETAIQTAKEKVDKAKKISTHIAAKNLQSNY